MPVLKIHQAKHVCDIRHDSDTCLARLPPQVNRLKKWFHNLRRHTLASGTNMHTTFVLRSLHTLKAEKLRQVNNYPWYIIHPYSLYFMVNEMVMTLVWCFVFFKDPLMVAFFPLKINILASAWQSFDLFLDCIQVLYIVLCFITGYTSIKTKEVVLEPRLIAKQYLRTYFVFDFLGAFPMNFLACLVADPPESYLLILSMFRLLRVVRIKTMLRYSRQITMKCQMSDVNHVLFCMFLGSIYVVHWGTCALALVPRVYLIVHGVENPYSWLTTSKQMIKEREHYKYVLGLKIFIAHFFGAAPYEYGIVDTTERLVGIVSCLSGMAFLAGALAVMFINISARGSSESKYEELIHHFDEFCKRKRLPSLLRTQIHLYYEHRFQKRFFREKEILNSISPHMKYQITLISCRYLFDKVTLFAGMSKALLGTIIGSLTNHIYLPRDVIMSEDDFDDCMYFIAYGTVAVYNKDGNELCHLVDGNIFGECLLACPSLNKESRVVAIETTEVFQLERDDFVYCLKTFGDFSKKLKESIAKKLEYMDHLEKQITESKLRRADIIFDLRRGKIIEKNKHRQQHNQH